jgi:hypothetical protein
VERHFRVLDEFLCVTSIANSLLGFCKQDSSHDRICGALQS